MRKRMAVVAVLAMSAGLALSACDGGDGPPDPTTSPTTATTESATSADPTTEPSSDAPTPPEAEAPTPAPEVQVDDHVGAIWAARYFFDLYAYMRQTGDTAQFEAMSASECKFCASSVERASEIHEAGGWVEGGELIFDVNDATAEYPTDTEPNYLVRFEGTEQPSETFASDGSSTSKSGTTLNGVVALQYVNGRFVVFGVNAE